MFKRIIRKPRTFALGVGSLVVGVAIAAAAIALSWTIPQPYLVGLAYGQIVLGLVLWTMVPHYVRWNDGAHGIVLALAGLCAVLFGALLVVSGELPDWTPVALATWFVGVGSAVVGVGVASESYRPIGCRAMRT